MEIWLGQDPLQIVGSFVVQLSKPDSQANLIYIFEAVLNSVWESWIQEKSLEVFTGLLVEWYLLNAFVAGEWIWKYSKWF